VSLSKPPIKHEMGFELLTGRLTSSNPSHRTQDLPWVGLFKPPIEHEMGVTWLEEWLRLCTQKKQKTEAMG